MRFLFLIFFVVGNMLTTVYAYNNSDNLYKIDELLNADIVFDTDYSVLQEFARNRDSVADIYINDKMNSYNAEENDSNVFKCLFILGQLNLYKYNYSESERYFNKALSKINSNKETAVVLYKLSELKEREELYPESIEYIRQTKELLQPLDFPSLYAKLLLNESFNYIKLRNFKMAEQHLEKASDFIKEHNVNSLLGSYYTYKGIIYYNRYNYLNALANFKEGLSVFKKDTVIENYATILYYTGKIYFNQENYKKALIIFNDVVTIYEKLNDIKQVGLTHVEIASSNIKLNKTEHAKYHLEKAKRIFDRINYSKGIYAVNIKCGQMYILNYSIDSALLYLHKIRIEDLTDVSNTLRYEYYKQLTNCYLEKNNMDSAMYFFNKTKTYCYDKTDIYNQIDCKIFIAKMMGATGDYMEAYKNQRAATSLINSLYRFTNSYEINILQTKLEASRKQVVINTLTDECNLQHQTINDNIIVLEKQKDYIRLGIIFLSLLILLILLIIYHLQQKRKDNKELRNKNIKIAQQKEEIEQQSYHLLEINEELEKLSLVAKETGNGIKIMDESGRVIWINEGYTKMHGYTLSDFETVGNVIDILGEQASIDIHQLLNTWYGDKQPITFESLNKTKSGEDIWIHTVLTPIFGESGRIQKMIAVDTDITIIKKVEQELTLKNENITASISYAQRIQEAMTTPFSVITNYYKNSFKFYKPKSIVSGDFYWASHTNNRLVIACADSTGHGVPGAFMSMIGMSFLNKIVNEKGIVSPDLILNRMRKNLINHLRQDDNEIIAEDGFDMSVISIDIKNYKLEYAGAMNPIYIIRGDEFIELKADRMPVAYFDNVERPFTKKEIELKKGDIIYMFTDGYYDQFGGDNGSKMKGNRFRTVLKATSSVSVTEQQNIIDNAFYKWKREYPQIDDVLVMCINVD